VTKNLADLRAEPDHLSECASQLRFGEIVSLGAKRKGFMRVSQDDGYRGWLDLRYLQELSSKVRTKGARYRVVRAITAPVFDGGGAAVSPFFLYYGTRVKVSGRRGKWTVCLAPDGTRFLISTRALAISDFGGGPPRAGQLLREARRFLGVPYVWGGVSPAGFDCSGFVQTLFRRFGILLPRDTKDQIRVGRAVDVENIRPGDLLFFRRHVGIAMTSGRLIHASRGSGGVAVNSLRPDDDHYRKDLHDTFATARRIL